ncbi:serine protease inhibitor dipetalogastin-like [Rhodnius prolixus]|uniref:serine protease inhibitor dipetalogastin-like n=1 Tax=Rhodnius prolixus TaxID=13249 RepID=UPI003D18D3A6
MFYCTMLPLYQCNFLYWSFSIVLQLSSGYMGKDYHLPKTTNPEELEIIFADCEKYNTPHLFGGPVCGNDSLTYNNVLYLHCINFGKSSSEKVEATSQGPCAESGHTNDCPWSPLYRPVCGSDNNTYANVEALLCQANKTQEVITVAKKEPCERVDPCRPRNVKKDEKVCTSIGKTFATADAVRCLRYYHSDIYIKHLGGCTVEEVKNVYRSREKICAVAKEHYEWNPICSTDGKTCPNPFVFICNRPLASAKFNSECHSELQEACKQAAKINSKLQHSPQEINCTYSCGSNGFTYRSEDHLLCDTAKDRHLYELHPGKCEALDSPCFRTNENGPGTPVCGSDGVTYANPASLYCVARTRDPDVHYVHDGYCAIKLSYK